MCDNRNGNPDTNKKKDAVLINGIIIICVILTIVALLSFLFVLFGTASFIASVKNTVSESLNSLLNLYNSSQTGQLLTAEELREAQNYISEAREFFSVSSNNTVISIIYAFSTTIILTIGTLVVGRLTKKSDEVHEQLEQFKKCSGNLSNKISKMNNQLTSSEKRMKMLQQSCAFLLDLQNIYSNIHYSLILLRECENNLSSQSDNFRLLNNISSRLMMIPQQYRDVKIEKIKESFVQVDSADFSVSLYLNLVEFANQYKSLVKHYIDYYSDSGKQVKHLEKQICCDSIDEIINDINVRLNNDFFSFV